MLLNYQISSLLHVLISGRNEFQKSRLAIRTAKRVPARLDFAFALLTSKQPNANLSGCGRPHQARNIHHAGHTDNLIRIHRLATDGYRKIRNYSDRLRVIAIVLCKTVSLYFRRWSRWNENYAYTLLRSNFSYPRLAGSEFITQAPVTAISHNQSRNDSVQIKLRLCESTKYKVFVSWSSFHTIMSIGHVSAFVCRSVVRAWHCQNLRWLYTPVKLGLNRSMISK